MTDPDGIEAMREVAREVLREVVESASLPIPSADLAEPNPRGGAPSVPRVPAPPVAAVLRPSTWTGPAVPGEVIGTDAPRTEPEPMAATPDPDPEPGAYLEPVTIDTDEDLERFVRALLARLESPRDRRALRAGRVRFTLRRRAAGARSAASAPALRIPKGAVTERAVREAAERGARLVLARGAVLTPLARDQARALGVEIEKEGRC